jgi:hypothetical protein
MNIRQSPTDLYGVHLSVANSIAPKLACQLSMQSIAPPAGTAQHITVEAHTVCQSAMHIPADTLISMTQ